MDNFCTIQVFQDDQWIDAAVVNCQSPEINGANASSTTIYDMDYAINEMGRRDAGALSWALPVSIAPAKYTSWPPFLMDLLPQGFGRQELLKNMGYSVNAELSGDWPVLLAGAGNPIGNLRVAEAHQWLLSKTPHIPKMGFQLQEIIGRSEDFIESLIPYGLFITGSSGVQGAWPKLLLTEGHDGLYYLDHALPDHETKRHWLVKFFRGQDPDLKKIFLNEARYMRLAKYLELETHGDLELYENALFIPRFDRKIENGKVLRYGQESVAVLCDRAGFGVHISHNVICRQLALSCSDPVNQIVEYLKRDIANIMLANRDNHTRNTAVARDWNNTIKLTPLFDFAPMYLHPDGIGRETRWEKDDGGAPIWGSVMEQIQDATKVPALLLQERLIAWLPKLQGLIRQMALENVDGEIIEYCRLRIDGVCQQIEDM